MRTIQNAFQISFLLRECAIVIEQDESGYPTVRPANDIDKNETYDDSSHQMVSNISTKLCDVIFFVLSRAVHKVRTIFS